MQIKARTSWVAWIIILIGSVFLARTIQATPAERDSLERILPKSEGEAKLEVMNDLAGIYMREGESFAKQKALEAIQFSEDLDAGKGRVRAVRNLGNYHYFQSQYDSSIYYHRLALTIAEEKSDSMGIAQTLNGMGVIFDVIGQPDSAISHYLAALEINESINNKEGVSNSLSNIAFFHQSRGNDPEAIRYFNRCLEIDQDMDNQILVATDLSNLGSMYTRLGQHQQALNFHQQALAIRRELNAPADIARSLNNLSVTYEAQKNLKKALAASEEALAIKRTLNDDYDITLTLNNLAHIHLNLGGNFEKAKALLLEATQISDTLGIKDLQIMNAELLADAYYKLGRFQQAYDIGHQLRILEEENRVEAKDKRIEELLTKFDAMDQKMELDSLHHYQEIQEQKIAAAAQRNFFLLVGLSIFVVLAIIIFILFLLMRESNGNLRTLNKRLEERNQQIAEKNTEIKEKSELLGRKNQEILEINSNLEDIVEERTRNLKETNKELDTFVYQTSHALRAPLMRVIGLFSIIRDSDDEITRAAMQSRIDETITGMDRMLYKLLDVQEIKLRELEPARTDLSQTLDEVITEIQEKSELTKAEFALEIPQQKVYVPDRFVLRAILINIIENAYHFRKDADPENHKIKIQIENQENSNLKMVIEDEGMGIPADEVNKAFEMFYRGTYKSQGTGLGLYVVHKSLERLGGTGSLESKEGEWTRIVIDIPLPKLSY